MVCSRSSEATKRSRVQEPVQERPVAAPEVLPASAKSAQTNREVRESCDLGGDALGFGLVSFGSCGTGRCQASPVPLITHALARTHSP